MKKHDVLKDTYCIYCQKEYGTPRKLQNHLDKKHVGTYAHASVHRALTASRIDPGVRAVRPTT